jgi:hypothetical protein
VQADGTLYFTGKHQGDAVRFSHQGPIGQGKWYVYSGKPGDRTRVVISDRGGLQEILSMDKGQRMTVNHVGGKRIEYRNYSSSGKFVFGSVLYLKGNKWLQGLMFAEVFAGYDNLVNVTDVTAQVTRGLADTNKSLATAELIRKQGLDLIISTACAADCDSGCRTFAGVVWDMAKTVGWNGLATMTGIAAATLGAAETGAVITTVGGTVVEGTVAALSSPVVVGVIIGSLAYDKKDIIKEKFNNIVAVASAFAGGDRNKIQITDSAPSAENKNDYASFSSPTAFSTTASPVVPEPTKTPKTPTITKAPAATITTKAPTTIQTSIKPPTKTPIETPIPAPTNFIATGSATTGHAKTRRDNDPELIGTFKGSSKNAMGRKMIFSGGELVISISECSVRSSYVTTMIDGVKYITQTSLSDSPPSCGGAMGIKYAASYGISGSTLTIRNPNEVTTVFERQ